MIWLLLVICIYLRLGTPIYRYALYVGTLMKPTVRGVWSSQIGVVGLNRPEVQFLSVRKGLMVGCRFEDLSPMSRGQEQAAPRRFGKLNRVHENPHSDLQSESL